MANQKYQEFTFETRFGHFYQGCIEQLNQSYYISKLCFTAKQTAVYDGGMYTNSGDHSRDAPAAFAELVNSTLKLIDAPSNDNIIAIHCHGKCSPLCEITEIKNRINFKCEFLILDDGDPELDTVIVNELKELVILTRQSVRGETNQLSSDRIATLLSKLGLEDKDYCLGFSVIQPEDHHPELSREIIAEINELLILVRADETNTPILKEASDSIWKTLYAEHNLRNVRIFEIQRRYGITNI
ncbi:hypothetical protein [Pseudomonas viridiflava]|uniref:hypothetical protein n=1 Tax=Pseudomonas viridiflava TaxID=33069 RepID=UPI000F04CFC9|nr:hypothetical protein [Pseudomonas viridiflava]